MVFVVVHLGAGYHTPKSEPALKKLAKEACLAAVEAMRRSETAASAAEGAMVVMEDSPLYACTTAVCCLNLPETVLRR